MRISDWSSDVCSSDLTEQLVQRVLPETGKPGYAVEVPEDASFQSVVLRGKDGRAKAALIVPRDPMIADHVGGAITYVSPEVRSKGVTTRLHNLARDAGLATEARREVQSQQRSEEHTSELQSLMRNSYAVF